MSDATQLSDTIRTQTLELVKQGQQATVQAVEAWAGLVTRSVPEGVDFASYTDRFPDPTQVTEQVFDFTEQLLASQREFVTGLAGAVVPVTEVAQRRAQDAAKAASTGTQSTKSTKK
jgi:hypothetical protein